MSRVVDKRSFRYAVYEVESPKVVFVYTGMGTRIGLHRPFVKLMNRRGYSCVVFDYPLRLLFEPSFDGWRQFYDDIIAETQSLITAFRRRGRKQFFAYGISMGTLIANKLTRETTDIKHVVLNLTYGDVADNIWSYRGVRRTKQALIKQGKTKADLRRNVAFVDPIVNAAGLKNKKVLLHLSRRDKVLRYHQTRLTYEAFKAAGLDMLYKENKRLGHLLGGTKNLLNVAETDKFFQT